ncbi:flagellin [Alkalihalobacterium alkalinitrilicum]|uniref:flagellin N-terminal helical domain-containing protein n=1 Tax=Alkalihalobacterium alkalinitrilicum TaxID=427920 RepID=UPI000994F4AD|nr:flagellin [Alkalihalobacterium alkalinitrilicum]
MIINNNIPALNTYRQMGANQNAASNSMEKLASGLRINKAGDDAAGLAISEKMRAQVRGLDQANRNAQDGISMIQTAEGALQETHNILQRMRELATQAANDTNVEVDRNEIQKEMNQLTSEINRIGNTTEFNTQNVLDGGAKASPTTLGSNQAVGEAAKGALLQSTDPASVKAADFVLAASASSIIVNGSVFSLDATSGAHNQAVLTAYNNGTGDFAGLDDSAEGMKLALESLKTGATGIQLKDVADVNVTENGVVSITAKAVGDDSLIALGDDAGVAGNAAHADLYAQLGIGTPAAGATWEGTNGTTAKIEGKDISDLFGSGANEINADTLVGKKFDITVNGELYNVTLDHEAVQAGSSGNPTSAAHLQAVIADALTRAKDQAGETVDLVGDNMVQVTEANDAISFNIHADAIPEDGSVPSLKVSGDYASTILGGITNGQNAVGGTFNATFQIGANQGQSMTIEIADMRAQALGVSGTISAGSQGDVEGAKFTATTSVTNGTNNDNVEYSLDVSSHEAATAAIKVINNAIEKVSAERSNLGATQNRLEHTISNLGTSAENLQAAESRIRDVDMAREVMDMTKNNILAQASQAMLAQANQAPQAVLQLLG